MVEELEKIFKEFKIVLNDEKMRQIRIHFDLLDKWKDVHNLTTIKDKNKIFRYHYLDSILGLKLIEKIPGFSKVTKIYDLGSGAGFPGLVAGILWPEKYVYLIESLRKKQSFLSLSVSMMKLNRTNVLCDRLENIKKIPFAITRASFSLEKISNWKILRNSMNIGGKLCFWLSKNTLKDSSDILKTAETFGLVLEKQCFYELEPGHGCQIAVFHVER